MGGRTSGFEQKAPPAVENPPPGARLALFSAKEVVDHLVQVAGLQIALVAHVRHAHHHNHVHGHVVQPEQLKAVRDHLQAVGGVELFAAPRPCHLRQRQILERVLRPWRFIHRRRHG